MNYFKQNKKTTALTIVMLLVSLFSFTVNAQEEYPCPPGAWCHPNGSGMGGGPWETGGLNTMEDAASEVGEALKGNPCPTLDPFCNLAKFISDHIACGYGKDTPQYQMCSEKESSGKSLTKKEKEILNQINFKTFSIDPNFRPLYFDSKKGKESFKNSLNSLTRGKVVKTWKQGYSLTFGYKFYISNKKNDYGVMYYLKDKKGKNIGNFLLVTKNNRFYILKIKSKK